MQNRYESGLTGNAVNPLSSSAAQPPVIFEDHLGKRFDAVSPEGEPVEVFELKEQFSGAPSFEYALRKRVNTLTSFKDPSYASARGVRLGGGLAVVSDRVRGTRLSTLLETLERQSVSLEFNAAVCVLRQLVPAVAILHEQMTDVCHGTIAPERIVITSQGRVVLVEHVLASALEALHYSDQQYWEELRLAVPKTMGPSCFDQRSDVLQIGLVALALIHGRSLNDEGYPLPLNALVDRAWGVTPAGGLEPLPAAVRTWLNRALQIEPRQAFASATSAWSELKHALAPSNQAAELQALKLAIARCRGDSTDTVLITGPVSGPRAVPGPVASPVSTPTPTPVPAAPVTPRPMPVPDVAPAAAAASARPALSLHSSFESQRPLSDVPRPLSDVQRPAFEIQPPLTPSKPQPLGAVTPAPAMAPRPDTTTGFGSRGAVDPLPNSAQKKPDSSRHTFSPPPLRRRRQRARVTRSLRRLLHTRHRTARVTRSLRHRLLCRRGRTARGSSTSCLNTDTTTSRTT